MALPVMPPLTEAAMLRSQLAFKFKAHLMRLEVQEIITVTGVTVTTVTGVTVTTVTVPDTSRFLE